MGCCFSSEEDKDQDKTIIFPTLYMVVSKNGRDIGRIIIELFGDVPLTSENFRTLCSGERGTRMTYKGCPFHCIIPGQLVRAGDITNYDGSGGKSIYGDTFKDENFIHKHSGPGIISMATSGKDENNSQFQILIKKAPWLDGKNVVFGRVIHGMDVVKKMEECGQADGQPTCDIRIVECGPISFSNVCSDIRCNL